jgi:hypothetical protein
MKSLVQLAGKDKHDKAHSHRSIPHHLQDNYAKMGRTMASPHPAYANFPDRPLPGWNEGAGKGVPPQKQKWAASDGIVHITMIRNHIFFLPLPTKG